MLIEERSFQMSNKASPLGLTRQCRVAKNGEHLADGKWTKRRGISTALTVDMQLGTDAPFWFFVWKIGNNYYRVAVGDEVAALHCPWSNYVYANGTSYSSGAIYSSPTGLVDGFGLNAPTLAGGAKITLSTKYVDEPYSAWASGGYLIYAVSYSPTRRCKSPPTLIPGVTPNTDVASDIQWVGGCAQYLTYPAVSADGQATAVRWYRARVLSLDVGDYTTGPAQSVSELRFIKENGGESWVDYGLTNYSTAELLSYATDPIPPCDKALWWDGRGWWLKGAKTGCQHLLYYSPPACPETYTGSHFGVLAEEGQSIIAGESVLAISTDCGAPKALVAKGDTMLVLCEHGAWRVTRDQGQEGVYIVNQDMLWVGCVSAASIAHGPEGVYWTSHQGVAFWDGYHTPTVVTTEMLDPEDSDTAFASDMSETCAAYDVDRHLYIAAIPKSGGGQFGIALRCDNLQQAVEYSLWEFGATLGTITGMGYDWHTRQVIYGFGTTTVTAKTQVDDVYRDNDPTTGSTYDYEVELWCGEIERSGEETKHTFGTRVFVERPSTAVAQTLAVSMQALRTTEESAWPTAKTLTWAIGAVKPEIVVGEALAGRLLRVKITNTDAYGLTLRAVQMGDEEAIRKAHGVY